MVVAVIDIKTRKNAKLLEQHAGNVKRRNILQMFALVLEVFQRMETRNLIPGKIPLREQGRLMKKKVQWHLFIVHRLTLAISQPQRVMVTLSTEDDMTKFNYKITPDSGATRSIIAENILRMNKIVDYIWRGRNASLRAANGTSMKCLGSINLKMYSTVKFMIKKL
jgi:hypothetical protein